MGKINITKELVQYIAGLSKIELDDASCKKMQKELGAMVNYMEIINQLDTDNAEPLSHIFDITDVMREDEVLPSFDRDEILENAPKHTDETFVVPKTVE